MEPKRRKRLGEVHGDVPHRPRRTSGGQPVERTAGRRRRGSCSSSRREPPRPRRITALRAAPPPPGRGRRASRHRPSLWDSSMHRIVPSFLMGLHVGPRRDAGGALIPEPMVDPRHGDRSAVGHPLDKLICQGLDDPMDDVLVIEEPAAAVAALDPVRARLLAELREPASAATLATKVGLTRQKVNYHLRQLEAHGLVEVASTRSGAGSPSGSWSPRPPATSCPPRRSATRPPTPRSPDRLSVAYVVALAGRVVRELGGMARNAAAAGHHAARHGHRHRHPLRHRRPTGPRSPTSSPTPSPAWPPPTTTPTPPTDDGSGWSWPSIPYPGASSPRPRRSHVPPPPPDPSEDVHHDARDAHTRPAATSAPSRSR